MNKILHDYYYGRYCPAEKEYGKDSEYAKTLAEIVRRQEAFLAGLNPDDRTALKEIFSLQAALNGITAEDSFIDGMKHGFQLALTLMSPDPGEP